MNRVLVKLITYFWIFIFWPKIKNITIYKIHYFFNIKKDTKLLDIKDINYIFHWSFFCFPFLFFLQNLHFTCYSLIFWQSLLFHQIFPSLKLKNIWIKKGKKLLKNKPKYSWWCCVQSDMTFRISFWIQLVNECFRKDKHSFCSFCIFSSTSSLLKKHWTNIFLSRTRNTLKLTFLLDPPWWHSFFVSLS